MTLYISETETKVYTVKRFTSEEVASDLFGVATTKPLLEGYGFTFLTIHLHACLLTICNNRTAIWPAILELAIIPDMCLNLESAD